MEHTYPVKMFMSICALKCVYYVPLSIMYRYCIAGFTDILLQAHRGPRTYKIVALKSISVPTPRNSIIN